MKFVVGLLMLLGLVQATAAQDKIVVSGASGQLGGLVVEELLARKVAPQNLILVSRTPDTLKRYAQRGASVRFGDLSKPESLVEAYKGGTRMLLISVNGGGDQRPELHKAAIDAAIAAGVKQIAYTSYVNADRFTDSIIAGDHLRTEHYLQESGVAWTLLRNQIYADGLPDQAAPDGSRRQARHEHARSPSRVRDAQRLRGGGRGGACGRPGHERKAYNITGPDAIGPRELVKLVSEISGKRIQLVVLDEAAYRKYLLDNGTPETAINGALSFAAELNSPWLREPTTAVADLTGRPPTSVRSLLAANKKRLLAAAK